MTWTLLNNGIERPLADWGITSNLFRTLVSGGIDTVNFDIVGIDCDAPLPFEEHSVCVIKRDGEPWFQGLVLSAARTGSPEAERISYQLGGPWWYLENLIYQQKWFTVVDPAALNKSLVGGYKTHVILNQGINGSYLNTGQQIADAVQWAIDAGAPIATAATYDANTLPVPVDPKMPAVTVPFTEDRDVTVAEVIQRMLRFSPDAVTWFDYSTSPPTFYCRRRADLTAVTISFPPRPAGTPGLRAFGIRPRKDLLRPAVVLKFERHNENGGLSYSTVDYRIAPDNGLTPGTKEYLDLAAVHERTFGAFVATIELAGLVASYASATIECAPIQADGIDWWIVKDASLKNDPEDDPNAKIITLELTSVQRAGSLPNELIAGQIAPWMNFKTERETITCQIKKSIKSENPQAPASETTDVHTARIIATDAVSGTYQTLESAGAAEPIPEGLAGEFFKAINALQYEGMLELQEQEISGQVSIGNLVNLANSARPELEAMAAMVQQVTENPFMGQTSVTLGPCAQLGPADLVELMRVNRYRRTYTAPSEKLTGVDGSASRIVLGTETPKENSTAGAPNPQRVVIATPTGGSILDLHAVKAEGRLIYIRKIDICIDNQNMKMLLLASDPFIETP